MRAYLHDLLTPHYRIEEAKDGQAGLDAARRLAAEGHALGADSGALPRADAQTTKADATIIAPDLGATASKCVIAIRTDNCCTALCDLSGADPCIAPATCVQVLMGPAPGFEDIGACFVPA